MTAKVTPAVTFDDLNIAEQAIPTESERTNVANNTPTIRNTSAGSTHPISTGTTSIGTAASRPNTP